MPGQGIRKRSVAHKLSPIEIEFKGKNVLLVDDSIVRGNTSKKIIEMVRKTELKECTCFRITTNKISKRIWY